MGKVYNNSRSHFLHLFARIESSLWIVPNTLIARSMYSLSSGLLNADIVFSVQCGLCIVCIKQALGPVDGWLPAWFDIKY